MEGQLSTTKHELLKVREMLEMALATHEFIVCAVPGVAEASELAGSFDIAVVDVNLADGDGIALLEQLHGSGRARAGLLITGAATLEQTQFRALRKPFQVAELARLIRATVAELPQITAAAPATVPQRP